MAVDALAERLRELVDEAPDEQRNVLGTLAQRRHINRKDVESVVEILPERIVGDTLLEVAVSGRDDSDVDVHGFRASEPFDLPLLEHAQQLDLNVERQVADLVEKDRRVVRELEASDLSRQRSGERALLAAEQFALDERARNRRAVDAHHDAAVARALFVNLRRDELLAGSGFAEQQHRRVGGGNLARLLEHPLDGSGLVRR